MTYKNPKKCVVCLFNDSVQLPFLKQEFASRFFSLVLSSFSVVQLSTSVSRILLNTTLPAVQVVEHKLQQRRVQEKRKPRQTSLQTTSTMFQFGKN
jgi:hypothetical protein